MALNSLQLFLSQVQSAPEVLKIRVLQIVFDILMVQPDFLGPDSPHVCYAHYSTTRPLISHSRANELLISCFMFWTMRNRTRSRQFCVLVSLN